MTSYNSYDRYFKNKKPKLVKNQKNLNFNFLFEVCIFIILGLTLMYFIVFPLTHNLTLIRLAWMPGFIFVFISCFICITQQNEALEILQIISFLILVMILIGSVILSGFNYDLVFSSAAFLTLLLSMWFYSGVNITKRLFNAIYYVAIILSCLFIIYYFSDFATMGYHNGKYVDFQKLTLGFDNPNTTGMHLYGTMSILIVNFSFRKCKILNAFLIFLNLFLIYQTNSRSCLIAAIFLLVITIFLNGKQKIPNLILLFAWLFPIVFSFVYLYLYNSGYENIEVLNKSFFSGRQNVFMEYLSNIKKPVHYIFGNLTATKLQNGHNAPLSIFCSTGIVGVIISEMLILLSVLRINIASKNANLSVIVILGYLIHSCAEASMFLGVFPSSVFVIIFYLLANYRDKNNEKVLF